MKGQIQRGLPQINSMKNIRELDVGIHSVKNNGNLNTKNN